MRVESVKRRVKEIAGEALLRTGLWRRHLEGMARRGEAILLTYHRVIEKWDRTLDYSQPGMVVTGDTFDRQLTFLKQHFSIVSMSDMVNPQPATRNSKSESVPLSSPINSQFEIRNSKFVNRPMCAITFDDGWRDTYEIAFPILRKHDVSATVFLTTDFIGANRTFWHTRLIYVVLHWDFSNRIRIHGILPGYPAEVRHYLMNLVTRGRAPSVDELDPFVETVKATCDEDTIEELIKDLAYIGSVRRSFLSDRRFFLDWHQVQAMATSGIEIGSHGCSHRMLTRLRLDEVEDELMRSKMEIEERIGQDVRHFAFPEGAANRTLIEAVRKAGYKSACLLNTGSGKGQVGFPVLRRVGMHEAVSRSKRGSFSGACLAFWLVRAPRVRLA